MLTKHGVRCTFFFLGWVAERQPHLVRQVCAAGHEVATHGYGHKLIWEQTQDEFREDVARSLRVLEDAVGERILGYRAPSFSVTPRTAWALDVLRELGLRYDSSIFPIHHDLGGVPDAPRHPYLVRDDLWEIPPATWRVWRWNLPVAGGGYLRLYPYHFTSWAVRRINREGLPVVVYVHPWELDPDQPRIEGATFLSRFRHYQNLGRTETRLKALFRDFQFAPIRDVLANWAVQSRSSNA
jgi:polysaccharide deacetylase family protein (PEP-CTERM system associated)